MQSRPTVDSKDNARQIAPEGATWETGGLAVPTAMRSRNPRAQCVSERKSRDGAAARLDFLSSNSVHITATGSGHEIQLYQPDRVVQALRQAVSEVRKR